MLLGIDVGTTHCKAGLFSEDGKQIATANIASPIYYDEQAHPYYPPEQLWQAVRSTIQQVTQDRELCQIKAVGVASMAETGLLLDRTTRQPKTPLLPWFSKQAESTGNPIDALTDDAVERFSASGIRPNYKCGLTKLLWLREKDEILLENAIWLSAADYVVFRLTNVYITDYSLAGRTYAFNIHQRVWDSEWLTKLNLPTDVFAPVKAAGTSIPSQDDCLAPNTPVCVAGHDHVCAAFAAGTTLTPGTMLDSMGTAETLLGSWEGQPLGIQEYESGLLFGCHVIPGTYYWMGSLSASGGSIEWLRGIFNHAPMSYDEIDSLLESIAEPTGILYFPYLVGSSANSNAQASFIGLNQSHKRAHLLKAVIEGTAYEIEYIRNTVESILSLKTSRIVLVGGGTRSPIWTQVKADVSGCDYHTYPLSEATLLGAALIAGIGSQVYSTAQDALKIVAQQPTNIIRPQKEHHVRYRNLYENGYLRLMKPLQQYYSQ